jgi:membrane protease YdiL (CAAX protease family)
MNLIDKSQQEHSAYLQLLMLVAFAIVGVVVGTILALIGCFLIYGAPFFDNISAILSGDVKYLNAVKILQIFTSLGLFLVPPVLLAWFQGKTVGQFYGFKMPKLHLLFIVLLIMVFSMPLMEWIAVMNQNMTLPGVLKPIERWMRQKEDAAMSMTILLLTVHNSWDFVLNLFMIALIPAVAEELMFRGGVQRSIYKMSRNPHIAIWVSAFLFSAIHVQFFGFVPRVLLGAAFGYLYYWSGSIWYSMAAHFINNAYAVCLSLYLQKHNIALDSTDPVVAVHWYGYLLSAGLTIFLFIYFKNQLKNNNGQ